MFWGAVHSKRFRLCRGTFPKSLDSGGRCRRRRPRPHLQLNSRPRYLARGHLGPEGVGGHWRQAGRPVPSPALRSLCTSASVSPSTNSADASSSLSFAPDQGGDSGLNPLPCLSLSFPIYEIESLSTLRVFEERIENCFQSAQHRVSPCSFQSGGAKEPLLNPMSLPPG